MKERTKSNTHMELRVTSQGAPQLHLIDHEGKAVLTQL